MKKRGNWDDKELIKMHFVADDEIFPFIERAVVEVKYDVHDPQRQTERFNDLEHFLRWCVHGGADALKGSVTPKFDALPPSLYHYLDREAALPEWVDRAELEEARKLYRDHFFRIISVFMLGAFPRYLGNELFSRALAHSTKAEQISVDDLKKLSKKDALYQALTQMDGLTAKMTGIIKLLVLISSKNQGLDQPKGRAVKLLRLIRLRHGFVRFYLKYQRGYSNPPHSKFDSSQAWDNVNGEPISQASLASAQVSWALGIIKGLETLGTRLTKKEKTRILLVWNIIAYYLGVEEELIPRTLKEAKELNRALQKLQFRVTPNAQRLLKQLQDRVIHKLLPFQSQVIVDTMRALMNDRVGTKFPISEDEERDWSPGKIAIQIEEQLMKPYRETFIKIFKEALKGSLRQGGPMVESQEDLLAFNIPEDSADESDELASMPEIATFSIPDDLL